MGTFLRLLGDLGYGWAYRVLDAQFVRVDGFAGAVPQRRRRLFVVAHLGDAAGPAAVLFERESLRGNPAPRRETGEGVAPNAAYGIDSDCLDRSGEGADGSAAARSGLGIVEGVSPALRSKRPNAVAHGFGGGNTSGPVPVAAALAALAAHGRRQDFGVETFIAQPVAGTMRCEGDAHTGFAMGDSLIAHALRADGFDASEDGTGRGTPLVPVAAFSVSQNANGFAWEGEVSHTLQAKVENAASNQFNGVRDGWAVRRLTPTECERLMGVPDGFTAITYRGKPAADGPRYKALGNSQAVNVMRWIARGLREVVDAQAGARLAA